MKPTSAGEVTAQVRTAVELLIAVADTIRETGSTGAPATSIYLAFQTRGLSFDIYTKSIAKLKEFGIIREENHTFYYIDRKC